MLIKYFPEISRGYDSWTGAVFIVGPTTGKNLLGVVALISGLFLFWDMVTRWPNRRERRVKRILLINFSLMAMTLWVGNLANSTTTLVCLGLGCAVIAAANNKTCKRNSGFLKTIIPASFCVYLILAFGLGMSGQLAGAVGKDPTLTDRTKIWSFVLSMHTNPLLGTGYESFWMGPRLEWFWHNAGLGPINEAHNGFLEVYLQLGGIGVCFVSIFLIASYWNICRGLKTHSPQASLNLAFWIVLAFYSVTEAAFRSNVIWLAFLLGAMIVPRSFPQLRTRSARVSTTRKVDSDSSILPVESKVRLTHEQN